MQTDQIQGRPNRKLRGHTAEITGWLEAGLSIYDIHRTIKTLGIECSYSSVYREIVKLRKSKPTPKVQRLEIPTPITKPETLQVTNGSKGVLQNKQTQAEIDRHFTSARANPLFKREQQ